MTDKQLVKGYVLQDYVAKTEKVFALYPDGRVMTCGPVAMPNQWFAVPGATWEPVARLPFDAYFCGNYAPPVPWEAGGVYPPGLAENVKRGKIYE